MPTTRLLALLPTLLLAACGDANTSSSSGAASRPGAVADVAALAIDHRVAGTGAEARPGMMVSVHYTGWLYDQGRRQARRKFDSSMDRGHPFEFHLGQATSSPAGMKG